MAVFYNQAMLSYNNRTVSSNIVTGEIADVLTVTKTAVSSDYAPGETITYAVALRNSGTSDLTGITLTDDLGSYTYQTLTLVPLTYVNGSVQYFADGVLQPAPTVTPGNTLVISGITVPADGDAVIIYQAQANEYAPAATGSSITNTVTATGAGTEITASATVPVANAAFLSIDKSLSPASVKAFGMINYTFVISNTGNKAENTAILSDLFDPALTGISVTIGGAPAAPGDYTYSETTGEFATTSGAIEVPAATYSRDADTGAVTVIPGTAEITVSGYIS